MIDRCPFGEMETCELWIEYHVLQNSLEESTAFVEVYMYGYDKTIAGLCRNAGIETRETWNLIEKIDN